MGFLKRMATILGFLHGNGEGGDRAENEDRAVGRDEPRHSASASAAAAHGVRRGFSVQVPVAVERPQVGPVLIPCEPEEGGVQRKKEENRNPLGGRGGRRGEEKELHTQGRGRGKRDDFRSPPRARGGGREATSHVDVVWSDFCEVHVGRRLEILDMIA
ncbi:hypothetical protein Taro_006559 [Colocasia esculenta]|uniref:Uncharacterized protein n=1 Tax=Colocasia esculenta TaxID=4460 RepID=A0A843TRH1_COLES|nr:hypothetical protein [Colocasia esculenta]